MNEPMVKLAGLYEKTSQKGNRYFIGRLGNARLLMFANQDKKAETDPGWWLYVQERSAEPKQDVGADRRLTTKPKQYPEAGDHGGIDGDDWPRRRPAA